MHCGQATSAGSFNAWWERLASRLAREVRFLGTGCFAICLVSLLVARERAAR